MFAAVIVTERDRWSVMIVMGREALNAGCASAKAVKNVLRAVSEKERLNVKNATGMENSESIVGIVMGRVEGWNKFVLSI